MLSARRHQKSKSCADRRATDELASRAPVPRTLRRLVVNTAGFTLIELLVAMVAGIVVIGALYTILEVSLVQSTKVANETYASQLGRTVMTKIVDELHNACISSEFTPVQSTEKAGEKSSNTKLIFINTYNKEPVPAIKEAYRHEIVWTAEAGSTTRGTLTDNIRQGASGTWPNVLTWGTATKELIGSRISLVNSKIFTYYKYATSSSQEKGALEEIKSEELTEKSASEVAAVEVNFNAAATTANSSLERSITLSNLVTFAFSAPSQETPIKDGPCQ
jgi:prepilin-type N-terminal cleavage/methylation domain-containing protein